MNNFYLLVGFNDYYNRQLKRLDTLQAYLDASDSYYNFNNITNFNPADGVSTKHIFNFTVYDINAPSPNYALVVDDDNTIKQRWFILDGDRTRNGQYQISLYRDTVAEAWTNIGSLPMFVEKAIVAQSDVAIFNSEGMQYNQIKKSENLLKDITGCPWIVGYMTQDNVERETNAFLPDRGIDYKLNRLSDYQYYQYTGEALPVSLTDTGSSFYVYMNPVSGSNTLTQMYFNGTYGMHATFSSVRRLTETNLTEQTDSTTTRTAFGDAVNARADFIKAAIIGDLDINNDFLQNEVGKIIYVSSANAYYRITLSEGTTEKVSRWVQEGTVFSAFENAIQNANSTYALLTPDSTGTPARVEPSSSVPQIFGSYKYTVTTVSKKLVLTQVSMNNSTTYKISTGRNRLTDQPYSMFCMPYGRTTIDSFVGIGERDFKEISLKVAKSISESYGGASPVLYDLQLLPYFPFRDMIESQNDHIELDKGTEGKDYDYIKQGSTNVGIIFWCTKSTDTFNIPYTISIADYKLDNETKMYRLCSPNYNGQFEFSAAKNGGVTSFNVDFTYKPYQPYIHVNPNFGKLYGQDFDDARGLICGGKFDLPQTSDAWATYERQNTNYNAIFNRKIESLELQNKYGHMSDMYSGSAGIYGGATGGMGTGMYAGMMLGGPIGGVIGAASGLAAGTISSTVGVIADVAINDKLRQENLDFSKDMFGFNMQNIMAQPDSLVSVGALNKNNKLFPFVEFYECDTAERTALINKIRYNGMTVGRIGSINEYKSNTWSYSNGWNYIKGQLIRCDINEDTHFITTLASELNKGIFMEV